MRPRIPQEPRTLRDPRLLGQKQRRVTRPVPRVHARAPRQQRAHDVWVRPHGGEVDGRVSRVIDLLKQRDLAAVQNLAKGANVTVADGVAQRREGCVGGGEEGGARVEGAGWVGEDGLGVLRHLAAEGARHARGDLGRREAGHGEEVGEFGKGRLDGQVEAEDDARAAEFRPRAVDWGDEAVGALRDVDNDGAALYAIADYLYQAAVDSARGVSHAEGGEDEAAQVREAKDGVDHLGLDAGEDPEAGNVGGVEVRGDAELGDAVGPVDEGPVDLDAEAVDAGEGLAIRALKGGKGRGGDLGGAVPTEEAVVEEEAHLGDDERAGDDEGAEEVVDGVGLQGEDGRLRARKDDGLAEVRHHEGEGRSRVRERVGAVEDDEAVEERVVLLDGQRDLLPPLGRDGARVQEGVELEDSVADVPGVGARRRPEAVQ